jgi:hypothetical protein
LLVLLSTRSACGPDTAARAATDTVCLTASGACRSSPGGVTQPVFNSSSCDLQPMHRGGAPARGACPAWRCIASQSADKQKRKKDYPGVNRAGMLHPDTAILARSAHVPLEVGPQQKPAWQRDAQQHADGTTVANALCPPCPRPPSVH